MKFSFHFWCIEKVVYSRCFCKQLFCIYLIDFCVLQFDNQVYLTWKEIHFYIAFTATNCGNCKMALAFKCMKYTWTCELHWKLVFHPFNWSRVYVKCIHHSQAYINIVWPRQCSQIVSESKSHFKMLRELSNHARTHTHTFVFFSVLASLQKFSNDAENLWCLK